MVGLPSATMPIKNTLKSQYSDNILRSQEYWLTLYNHDKLDTAPKHEGYLTPHLPQSTTGKGEAQYAKSPSHSLGMTHSDRRSRVFYSHLIEPCSFSHNTTWFLICTTVATLSL